MNELEAIWALTWRDLVRFTRDRSQILGALARPLHRRGSLGAVMTFVTAREAARRRFLERLSTA